VEALISFESIASAAGQRARPSYCRRTCGLRARSGLLLRRERAAFHKDRAVRGVADSVHQPVEELVEFRGCVEINRLREVVLGAVVADLVPLAVTLFGVGVGVVSEDEADGGNADAKEGIVVGAAEQP